MIVWNFFKRLAYFVLVTAGIVFVLCRLSLWGGAVDRDITKTLCAAKRNAVRSGVIRGEPGRTNVLFMGDSQILAGIMPSEFDGLCDNRTYSWNLALPAMPVGPQYFQLQDYLKKNPPPAIIVLSLAPFGAPPSPLFGYYGIQGAGGFGEIYSYYRNQSDSTILWNYVLPIRDPLYSTKFLQRAKTSLLHPGEIDKIRAENDGIVSLMFQGRGYYFMHEEVLPEDYVFPQSAIDTQAEQKLLFDEDPYVRLFFGLAQQNHIRVLLVEPAMATNRPTNRVNLRPYYEKFQRDYAGTVFFAKDGWAPKRYENRFFSDPVHLIRITFDFRALRCRHKRT